MRERFIMCKQKDLVQQSIEDKTYSNFHEAIRKIFTKEYFYKNNGCIG